ncbi:MAG: HAMP domain-containing histidine kinase [Spirochaetaceae bacterium]
MKFRLKLQMAVLPFIILPIILAGYIYSSIGRDMLRERQSEILQLRLDSLYRFAEDEYTSLKDLGLANSNFFNNKSWKSVEQFATQLQVPGDPLFIIRAEDNQFDLSGESGFRIEQSDLFGDNKVHFYYYRTYSEWNMILISATVEQSIYKSIENATRLFILFSLVNLLLSIIIVFVISNRITKPMEKLTVLAKEMANHNLSVRAEISSNDEIGLLSENFNIMVERLEESTKYLEDKVEIRTKELLNSLNKLQVTQKQLVEAEKMASLGSLVAAISHEINTPIGIGITAISYLEGYLKKVHNQFLQESLKKSDLDIMFLKCMESSVIALNSLQRAGQLVSTFKKVAVDQHIEEKSLLNMKEQMENVLLTLKPNLNKTRVSVTIKADSQLELYSYPGAIWQVTSNIILNALVHAFEPADKGSIIISLKEIDSTIELSISDNGKGIPESEISKVFDPFYTTKRHKGGTGLGLNIVYNIVTQLFKGTIKCSSVVGDGTIFTISFPID